MKNPSIVFLLFAAFTGSVGAAITDSSGQIEVTGDTNFSYTIGSNPVFIWDGYEQSLLAGTRLESEGSSSFSFGDRINVSGDYSVGIGTGASYFDLLVSGNYSFGFGDADGDEFQVTGNYSLLFGHYGWNNGDYSFGFGRYPDISSSAQYAFAFGSNPRAYASYSFAAGYSPEATGIGSVAIGYNPTASGSYSVSMGSNNEATGMGSVALGYYNSANSEGSMVAGKLSAVTLTSTFDHNPAFAFGEGLTVMDDHAFVIGRYNSRGSSPISHYLFVIGDGASDSERSDVFSVDEDGDVWVAGTITAGGGVVGGGSGGYTNIHESGGKIGIGTSNPATKLEVAGGSSGVETGLLQIRSNASSVNTGSVLRFVNSTNPTADYGAAEIATVRTTSSGSSNLVFRVAESASLTEALRIRENGNVGIGTAAPTAKLDVAGSARVRGMLNTDGWLRIGGSDLTLGTNDGRDQGPSKPSQRALVHTGADQLYINFNGDFEGGVVLQGKVKLAEAQGGISMGNFQ